MFDEYMAISADVNTDTNQTATTINQPSESVGVENSPSEPAQTPPEVPPVEVPGRNDTPAHVPEKSRAKRASYPALVKG